MKADPFEWEGRANCAGQPTALFFPDENDGDYSKTAYKRVCSACPVKTDCLQASLIYNFPGVWGGYSEGERNKLFSSGYRKGLVEDLTDIGEFVELKSVA